MIAVGIDPGLKGAVAVLRGHVVEIYDMPTFSGGKEQNHAALADLLRSIAGLHVDGAVLPSLHVGLEKASTRPGQAAQAVLKSGTNYGAILGVLASLGLEYSEITPVKWKNVMLAGFADKKDKANSEKRACQLYPSEASRFRTPRGALLDGRCEALLIARYTWDTLMARGSAAA